ncbi:EF-hand domain-containing protein [Roseomonas sp. KE0001]|uniref:EF-hand domain-containing protein n=1 Tax=Roseomonas sp. KE0001 TaxID=2479201 RepID=UPI0018E05F6E|nr:EF-hand domain-containing protein [Roseomonas sp. KE0001]MBI0435694.1 hypothetical protein [Roseomonas sp. KE0001]
MKTMHALALFGFSLIMAAPALAQPQQTGRQGMAGRLFQQADADRNGRVSEAEALNFLSARFAEADANGDGQLERGEIAAFMAAHRPASARPGPAKAGDSLPKRAEAMFRAADADRDGRLSLAEVRPVTLALFRAADANGDGQLEQGELQGPRRGEGPQRDR